MILSNQSRLRLFQIVKGQRLYSTDSFTLSFDKYSTKLSSKPPILICHGLFGSKKNWPLLAKEMSSRLSRDVYAIDCRNHGDSPRSEEHTCKAMTTDLVRFIKDHDLKNPILIGYSMGAKVVMETALENPEIASKLISVDMPPAILPLPGVMSKYCDTMKEIDDAALSERSEADKIMAKYEQNALIRTYLLANLKRTSENKLRFHYPYTTIRNSLPGLGAFDAINQGSQYKGSTLFILGGSSYFLKTFKKNLEETKALFPNSKHEIVPGASHFVIFERHDTVLNLITTFIDA